MIDLLNITPTTRPKGDTRATPDVNALVLSINRIIQELPQKGILDMIELLNIPMRSVGGPGYPEDMFAIAAKHDEIATLINALPDDTVAPVINITGGQPVVYVGESFAEPTVEAYDPKAFGGKQPLTIEKTGSVDTGTPGNYTLTYRATDDIGLSTTRDFIVSVLEDLPPVASNVTLTLEGSTLRGSYDYLDDRGVDEQGSIVEFFVENTPGNWTKIS